MRTGARVAAVAVLLLGLGASGVVCQRVAERGRFAVAYSSYGAGPEGTRALYLLAEQRGASPAVWARDLSGVPERAMLVALGGCDNLMARGVSRYEREELEKWLARGGTLVVAGAHDYLWPEIGVDLRRAAGCDADVGFAGLVARAERGDVPDEDEGGSDGGIADPGEPPALDPFDPEGTVETLEDLAEDGLPPPLWATPEGPPFAGLDAIPMRLPASITVADGAAATTLLRLPHGPAAVVLEKGEGRIVALASASPFQNRDLATSDGAVLFMRLVDAYAPEGPVLFDEYHLGVGERRSLTQYLRDLGGGAVLLQAVLVIAFLLWRSATRFGAVRTEPPPPPAGTASYVTAIGTLFRKSADAAGAVQLLARHALGRVASHYHFGRTEPEQMAQELEARGRRDEAAAVLGIARLARSPATHRRDLVARAREIDDYLSHATGGDAAHGGGADEARRDSTVKT